MQVVAQCQSAMSVAEVSGNVVLAKAVALVLSVLAGSARCLADASTAVDGLQTALFSTIEDFLWFRCHVAGADLSSRHAGTTSS